MAKSVNQVILLGRLTRDPEMRTTNSGKSIASFSLAVDRGGQEDAADFFDITAWEKLAELVDQYLAKGSKVLVQGRLRQDSWDDKDTGKKRTKIEVVATDVTFLDSKADAPSRSEPRQDYAPTADDIDDQPINLADIPF